MNATKTETNDCASVSVSVWDLFSRHLLLTINMTINVLRVHLGNPVLQAIFAEKTSWIIFEPSCVSEKSCKWSRKKSKESSQCKLCSNGQGESGWAKQGETAADILIQPKRSFTALSRIILVSWLTALFPSCHKSLPKWYKIRLCFAHKG